MPPVGFKPTISAGERPQTYALDRAAIGTGIYFYLNMKNHRPEIKKFLFKQFIVSNSLVVKYMIIVFHLNKELYTSFCFQ